MLDRSGGNVLFSGRMHGSVLRLGTTVVFGALVAMLLMAPSCPRGAAGLQPLGLAGSEGRTRYIVSFDTPAPELNEYRALAKDNPASVAAYVETKRQETARTQAALDAALAAVGGRVVERWWMSNQATIEIAAPGLATVRAVRGVKSVDPDQLLR